MDKKKLVKVGLTMMAIIVPFGLTAVAGYYGFKKWKEYGKSRDKGNKEESDK